MADSGSAVMNTVHNSTTTVIAYLSVEQGHGSQLPLLSSMSVKDVSGSTPGSLHVQCEPGEISVFVGC